MINEQRKSRKDVFEIAYYFNLPAENYSKQTLIPTIEPQTTNQKPDFFSALSTIATAYSSCSVVTRSLTNSRLKAHNLANFFISKQELNLHNTAYNHAITIDKLSKSKKMYIFSNEFSDVLNCLSALNSLKSQNIKLPAIILLTDTLTKEQCTELKVPFHKLSEIQSNVDHFWQKEVEQLEEENPAPKSSCAIC